MLNIGTRLCIMGDWDSSPEPEDRLVIRLVPSNAFGIGNHVSTQAFLRELEKTPPHGNVLDLGCGSGILAIAALKLGASSVACCDVNKNAIETVMRNIDDNDIRGKISVFLGDIRKSSWEGNYDLVMMNIDNTDLILDIASRVSYDSMLVTPETKYLKYIKTTVERAGLKVSDIEEIKAWTLIRIRRA